MKRILLLVCILSIRNIFSQQPFSVHVVPSSITVPALHSGAFAVRNNKWIFIGGRLDGMHIMQANSAFPAQLRNDSIYIVDPVINSYKSVSARQLPQFLFEAICSANMQFYQDENILYMIGGYGREDSLLNWITFPVLTSIDLDCLISQVNASGNISSCFKHIVDTNMAVTGGGLEKIDSTFYLVFGHRFDGRYSHMPMPMFTQRYTHEIRKFNISDNGTSLSISNYSVIEDTNVFHRRDFNLVPQIYNDHSRGASVFGGVFQKNVDLPFLTPIDITSSGVHHQSSFNENLNQYTTAVLPIYDSLYNYMHNVFFGGISLYTLDTMTMNLIQDTLVPFVSTISKVTRDSTGILSESKFTEDMPALKGTNAFFIYDWSAPLIDGRILDINSLSGNTRVGFIFGGIHSDAPNVATIDPEGMSRPNSVLYEVWIDKNVSATPEIVISNSINNLLLYPNPVRDYINLSFSLKDESNCEIKLYNLKGQVVKTFLKEKKVKGEQKYNFSVIGVKSGVYFLNVRAGRSNKSVRVILK